MRGICAQFDHVPAEEDGSGFVVHLFGRECDAWKSHLVLQMTVRVRGDLECRAVWQRVIVDHQSDLRWKTEEVRHVVACYTDVKEVERNALRRLEEPGFAVRRMMFASMAVGWLNHGSEFGAICKRHSGDLRRQDPLPELSL